MFLKALKNITSYDESDIKSISITVIPEDSSYILINDYAVFCSEQTYYGNKTLREKHKVDGSIYIQRKTKQNSHLWEEDKYENDWIGDLEYFSEQSLVQYRIYLNDELFNKIHKEIISGSNLFEIHTDEEMERSYKTKKHNVNLNSEFKYLNSDYRKFEWNSITNNETTIQRIGINRINFLFNNFNIEDTYINRREQLDEEENNKNYKIWEKEQLEIKQREIISESINNSELLKLVKNGNNIKNIERLLYVIIFILVLIIFR